MIVSDSANLLFILANAGAGGHRLGRIISCIDDVYWYSSENNGINPWDIFFDDVVSGKNISPFHYDRLINNKQVPLLGERIEKWWEEKDVDYFYKNIWSREFYNFNDILEKNYIHWILHDTPDTLISRFPNAKIIALIDDDVGLVTKRYIETTASFPVNLKLSNLRPDYLNDYANIVEELKKHKEVPTEYDVWAADNHNESYEEYVYNMLDSKNQKRLEFSHPNYLKISWKYLYLTNILNFLGSKNIHMNYKKLIKD
jgi:hypothetical protein